MNALTHATAPTMTSTELVEFINADRRQKAEEAGAEFPSKDFATLQNKHFLAKVPEVLGAHTSANFLADLPDSYGRPQPGYRFPKREACLMAMSYSYSLQAKVFDRMTELEAQVAAPTPVAPPAPPPITPITFEAELGAVARIMADDRLKALMPLLWQEITDTAQNALRNVMGTTLALPAPDAPKPLDGVEIAKREGTKLPVNLRGEAGKYVKARSSVPPVATERLIYGSIRSANSYTNHAEVAGLIGAYLASKLELT